MSRKKSSRRQEPEGECSTVGASLYVGSKAAMKRNRFFIVVSHGHERMTRLSLAICNVPRHLTNCQTRHYSKALTKSTTDCQPFSFNHLAMRGTRSCHCAFCSEIKSRRRSEDAIWLSFGGGCVSDRRKADRYSHSPGNNDSRRISS